MYDWIIESDIIRLTKELGGEADPAKRQRLAGLIASRRRQLPNAPALYLPTESHRSSRRTPWSN